VSTPLIQSRGHTHRHAAASYGHLELLDELVKRVAIVVVQIHTREGARIRKITQLKRMNGKNNTVEKNEWKK
jgi:hypothetical protein